MPSGAAILAAKHVVDSLVQQRSVDIVHRVQRGNSYRPLLTEVGPSPEAN